MKNLSTLLGIAVLALSSIASVNARFGQEHNEDSLLDELKGLAPAGDQSAYIGNLCGSFNRALLAKAPECSQDQVADNVVDMASIIGKDDPKVKSRMIEIAQALVVAEKNTPNDGQPSALCTDPPRNKELDGLAAKRKQDPTPNTKNLDPFVPNPAVDAQIPKFVVDGKTLVPSSPSTPKKKKAKKAKKGKKAKKAKKGKKKGKRSQTGEARKRFLQEI